MNNKNELLPNQYYHIYNRGNGKNKIFFDKEDYNKLLKLFYVYNSEINFRFRDLITSQKIEGWDLYKGDSIVDICAWVLMPNHFHLIIISHRSDLWIGRQNPITEFMRKVFTSYSMYLNKKYNRTGSLFEGRFKSRLIDKENYLNYLFAYIHLNPIKLIQKDWKEKGIKDKNKVISFLNHYKFSSFLDFSGFNRKENKIINKESVPQHILKSQLQNWFDWFEKIDNI